MDPKIEILPDRTLPVVAEVVLGGKAGIKKGLPQPSLLMPRYPFAGKALGFGDLGGGHELRH